MHSLLDSPDNPASPPFLFSAAEISELEESRALHERRSGCYTAERLHSNNPAKYAAIARALGEGMGIRQIARAYQVHHRSVAAVQERERIFVDTQKERTVSNLRTFAGLAVERMIDELDSMKLESLPLATAIALDKAELLSGGVTARIGHVTEDRMNDLADVLAAIPEADAEVVEENRFTGPETFAKGAELDGLPAGHLLSGSIDVESTVLQREQVGCPAVCPENSGTTTPDPSPSTTTIAVSQGAEIGLDRAAHTEGGGGGRENAGGVTTGIGWGPETISAMELPVGVQVGAAGTSEHGDKQ